MKRKIAAKIAIAVMLPTASFADWTGGYAGLSLGQTSDAEYAEETSFEIDDSSSVGGFAGYQIQNGMLVFGGELALSGASDAVILSTPDFEVDPPIIDIKGRVGYSFGDVLAYGVLGLSFITLSDGDTDLDGRGTGVGLGVDYMISDSVTVGAEYLTRRTSGEDDDTDEEFDIDLDSFSLRASFRF